MDSISSGDFSLMWGSLRNLVNFEQTDMPSNFKLMGATMGAFPLDSYRPILLEAPKGATKKHVAGRINRVCGVGMHDIEWQFERSIPIPIYHDNGGVSVETLGKMFKHWREAQVPDEIPCIALAVRARGYYSDERECQSLLVLVIWHDAVAKILHLDWAEGPLEDCITPEWYLTSTNLLSLANALGEIKRICPNPQNQEYLEFSICVTPSCLGDTLHGNKKVAPRKAWPYEWTYKKQENFVIDLDIVLNTIKNIFTIKSAPHMENSTIS